VRPRFQGGDLFGRILAFSFLLWTTCVASQNVSSNVALVSASLPAPSISLRHPVPAQSPVSYTIDLKIPESPGDSRQAHIHIICWPQEVDCKPTSGPVVLGPASSTPVVVDIPANINSVKLTPNWMSRG